MEEIIQIANQERKTGKKDVIKESRNERKYEKQKVKTKVENK